MAELHVVEDERPGILKEIDEGAMDLIFQAIQQDIYSYPMKSFIRESISNGLDSIIERNIFFAITSGKPVSDYFLQREDDKLLKDSKYTPEYYDPKFLSSNTKVQVTYKEGFPRDLVSIKDEGVGLGGSRLKGYFKLGYSSKRNMKDVIGKFGAGAKAGLATGVEYFVMHTTYNGYKTSFMIFNNDYENITPKQDNSLIDVWVVKMANGGTISREIYWNPTTEKNGVQVDLEIKKHNKALCIDAVTQQFQYFGGKVQLRIIDGENNSTSNTLDAKPLYESDALLIPKYSTYSSPHILVDGISYGLISWDELELDRRQGKIAIKVKATDVDITQSRESLKWTEKTKDTVLRAIKVAKDEAEDYVASLLTLPNPENLIEVNNIYGSLSRGHDESVGSVFSTFLVMHSITPKVDVYLSPAKIIKGYLSESFFEFLFYPCNIKKLTLNSHGSKLTISAHKVDSFYDLRNSKIIYAESSSVGPKLVSHLLNKFSVNSLIYVRPIPNPELSVLRYNKQEYSVEELQTYSKTLFKNYSTLFIDNYEVKYDEKEEDLEKEIESDTQESKVALATIRKMNKEVLYTTYNTTIENHYNYDSRDYEFIIDSKQERHTIKIKNIEETIGEFKNAGKDVIVCTGKYAMLGKIIELSAEAFNKQVKVMYVAQDVVPHFAPFAKTFDDYFREINTKTGELMIGSHIRDLNTWRILFEIIKDYPEYAKNYNLLKAFTSIDVSLYSSIISRTRETNPRTIIENSYSKESSPILDDIFGYLRSLEEFQAVVQTADKDLIAEKALILFKSDEIFTIDAYDEEFIGTIKSELKRLHPIKDVLTLMETSGDFVAARPLIDELLLTLNKKDDNI